MTSYDDRTLTGWFSVETRMTGAKTGFEELWPTSSPLELLRTLHVRPTERGTANNASSRTAVFETSPFGERRQVENHRLPDLVRGAARGLIARSSSGKRGERAERERLGVAVQSTSGSARSRVQRNADLTSR